MFTISTYVHIYIFTYWGVGYCRGGERGSVHGKKWWTHISLHIQSVHHSFPCIDWPGGGPRDGTS